MKSAKTTFKKQLTNSDTCTCIVVMIAMAKRATSTTNIAALATGHNHCKFIHCNANAWFRVFDVHEDLIFAKTTNLHSTAVLY